MARRLTTFSKLLITMLIVGALVFAGNWFLNNTDAGRNLQNQADGYEQDNVDRGSNDFDNSSSSTPANRPSSSSASGANRDDVIRIGVVTWGGYAAGQYFNEGFEANRDSRFYKDYGFMVEFEVLDQFVPSREAWKNDKVDLLWATIDAFPTEAGGDLKQFDPVVLFQADWSRGGDAIVARRGITKVADLKGKTIAVAELTPSHSFLLWMLEAGGLTQDDVKLVPQEDAIQAAAIFKSGRVDAAVVWSPDDLSLIHI